MQNRKVLKHKELPQRPDTKELFVRECPVSILARAPEAVHFVREIRGAECVKDASGAIFGGPDSSKWDALHYDRVRVLQGEEILIQNVLEDLPS